MEIDLKFKSILETCKEGKFVNIPKRILDKLVAEYILVNDNNDIYNQIKLERTLSRYNNKYLSLTIAPTTACNFRCKYCYEADIENKRLNATTVTMTDIVNFAKSFKSVEYLRVTWYGGEPLLMFDFIKKLSMEFIHIFNNYQAFIITNGYLMNRNVISMLKGLHISGVQITIDGLKETQNQRRPHCLYDNSFQVIIKNLDDLFTDYPEIRVALRVNIDKTNENEYHKLYKFLKHRYGNYKINIHPGYVTDDFSDEPNRNCMLQNDQNKFVIKQFDIHNIPISLYPKSSFGECGARHINSFVIGPEGELYKCWNDIGIKKKSIGYITNFSYSNKYCLKYLLENDPLTSERCKRCFYFPICDGGCPYKRIFAKESDVNDLCFGIKKNLKDLLERYINYKINKQTILK